MKRKIDSPYEKCPTFESSNFNIRLVEENDAEDLLDCYSDPISAKYFNSDNCLNNFVYKSVDEVKNGISFWLKEYRKKYYIRFSILEKISLKAIGTIEMFAKEGAFGDYGRVGVLRVDISSRYESLEDISELLELINDNFYNIFKVDSIITKAIPEAQERIVALKNKGYSALQPNYIVPYDHYYIGVKY